MSAGALYQAPPAGPVNANVTTAQLFPNKQVPSSPVVLVVLGTGRLEQRKFTARACGSVTTGTTSTVAATLYMAKVIPGTPFTAANWTVIGASTARSLASISAPWMIEANLQFESVGGTMQGTFDTCINNLADGAAAITNRISGLNGTGETIDQAGTEVVAAEPVFVIAVGLTFATANAGNIGTLGDFSLLPAD
jgi:hypothetical protein